MEKELRQQIAAFRINRKSVCSEISSEIPEIHTSKLSREVQMLFKASKFRNRHGESKNHGSWR